MLQILNHHRKWLFLEMDLDFVEDIVHPDYFCGDRKPVPTQRCGLGFQPLTVLFDIGLTHRR
ncbi:hypothetical protein D3C81_1100080 [compost metagenome]